MLYFFFNFSFFFFLLIFFFCCTNFFGQGPFQYWHYWDDASGLDRYSLNLPNPVTPVMLGIHSLHNHILFFIGIIFSVVTFLLFSILYYFSFYPDKYYRLSYYANCIRRFFDNLYIFLFTNLIRLLNSLKIYTSGGFLTLFTYILVAVVFYVAVFVTFVIHTLGLVITQIKDYSCIKIYFTMLQYPEFLSTAFYNRLYSLCQKKEYVYFVYIIKVAPCWTYWLSFVSITKRGHYLRYAQELAINYIYALRVFLISKFSSVMEGEFSKNDIESPDILAYFSSMRFMKTFLNVDEKPSEDEGELYGNKIRWLTYLTKHRQYRVTHNLQLEVIWTLIPTLILIIIAVPSFALLYSTDELLDVSLNIKVIGHQWYWSYEYSDMRSLVVDDIKFDSYMVPDSELSFGDLRLLKTDCPLILPKETNIRFLITSTDVLHSWAVPSFGIKMDAVPGRLNQTGAYIMEMGRFYGQCSELCGVNHGFMPIEICVIEPTDYYNWLFLKYGLSVPTPVERPLVDLNALNEAISVAMEKLIKSNLVPRVIVPDFNFARPVIDNIVTPETGQSVIDNIFKMGQSLIDSTTNPETVKFLVDSVSKIGTGFLSSMMKPDIIRCLIDSTTDSELAKCLVDSTTNSELGKSVVEGTSKVGKSVVDNSVRCCPAETDLQSRMRRCLINALTDADRYQCFVEENKIRMKKPLEFLRCSLLDRPPRAIMESGLSTAVETGKDFCMNKLGDPTITTEYRCFRVNNMEPTTDLIKTVLNFHWKSEEQLANFFQDLVSKTPREICYVDKDSNLLEIVRCSRYCCPPLMK